MIGGVYASEQMCPAQGYPILDCPLRRLPQANA